MATNLKGREPTIYEQESFNQCLTRIQKTIFKLAGHQQVDPSREKKVSTFLMIYVLDCPCHGMLIRYF